MLSVIPYRINLGCNLKEALMDLDEDYKYILIAGGDSTVDTVVNNMKELDIKLL